MYPIFFWKKCRLLKIVLGFEARYLFSGPVKKFRAPSHHAANVKNSTYHICEQWRLRHQTLSSLLTQYRELVEASEKRKKIWPHLMAAQNSANIPFHVIALIFLFQGLWWYWPWWCTDGYLLWQQRPAHDHLHLQRTVRTVLQWRVCTGSRI